MAELDPVFHAFAHLHRALVEPETLKATLDRLVALSVDAVPGCAQASITVAVRGLSTAAHSGPDVEAIDQVQYHQGGGPCVHASEVQEVVSMPDLSDDDRWPAFCQEALRRGICSSLSYPMISQGQPMGSMNLYGTMASGFDKQSERAAALFAKQGAIGLANAMNAMQLVEVADQLREGLSHRDVIGQAKGILMNQRKITADDAFDVLRESSQRQNRKLRDIAEDLANTGELV